MSNPFARDNTQPPPVPAPSSTAPSPFAAGPSGEPSGGGFDLPPCPVGVLRGTTVALRETQKGFALDVHCDDPSYPSKDNVGIWIGHDTRLLLKIAGALGITSEIRDGRVYFSDAAGNRDAEAFKNKPGLFIFAPYQGGPSINKFGLPKKGSSSEWDQYMEEANFSEEQIAALKKASGGVIPGDSTHLFD